MRKQGEKDGHRGMCKRTLLCMCIGMAGYSVAAHLQFGMQVESVIRELTGLQRDGVTAARRELLPLMLVLENSPVLCAYGLVRWAAGRLGGGLAGRVVGWLGG